MQIELNLFFAVFEKNIRRNEINKSIIGYLLSGIHKKRQINNNL